MNRAKVVFPFINRAFQLTGGMKSGWGLTANDNTLIHIGIIETFLDEEVKSGKIDKD